MDAGTSIAAVAAHRGWHAGGAPKNGMLALELAHANGADWVELDIRRLGDGTIIVFHDAHMDGVPLHRLDRRVLAAHPEVPTLEQWARRAGKLGIGVLAEFKEPGYEREALDILRRHVDGDKLDLMSFEPAAVKRLAQLAPDRPVGLLTYDLPATRRLRNAFAPGSLPEQARRLGASFVGLNVEQATDRTIGAIHARGLGAAVWTVDEPLVLSRLLADRRVATVITDVPGEALKLRGALAGIDGASAGVRLLRAAATMR